VLTFEGVEVQLSSKDNITYSYQDNYLVLLCREFTGCIVVTRAQDQGGDGQAAIVGNGLGLESPQDAIALAEAQADAMLNGADEPEPEPEPTPPPVPATPGRGTPVQMQPLPLERLQDSRYDGDAEDGQSVGGGYMEESGMTDGMTPQKRERIALLRKMVKSSNGAGSSKPRSKPGTPRGSRNNTPRGSRNNTPRGTPKGSPEAPPTPRDSIFESGSKPKQDHADKQPKHSFKPTINSHSAELVAARGGNHGGQLPVYQALYNKKNDKERRRKRAEEEMLTKEMADCTFQPNVNKTSRYVPEKLRGHPVPVDTAPIYMRSESLSKRKQAELESKREEKTRRERSECTFQPETHSFERKETKPSMRTPHSPGYDEFVQRQTNARHSKEELARVPHCTGENWKNQSTKVKGFKFNTRSSEDRAELRQNIKSLRKPTSPSGIERATRSSSRQTGRHARQRPRPAASGSAQSVNRRNLLAG